jgi:hypothetical protein
MKKMASHKQTAISPLPHQFPAENENPANKNRVCYVYSGIISTFGFDETVEVATTKMDRNAFLPDQTMAANPPIILFWATTGISNYQRNAAICHIYKHEIIL